MAEAASLASAVRFSVTDEMRSLAGQRSHLGRSIVLTSFLVGAPNKHAFGPTSFAHLAKDKRGESSALRVFRVVNKLRSVSPALCTPNTALLVAHDVAGIPASKDGVRYHHVVPDAASNSMNRRWEIYERILREYTFDCVCAHAPIRAMPTPHAPIDCVFAQYCAHRSPIVDLPSTIDARRPSIVDAIDATDVAVLWMPSCLALPERLVIGSDGASPSIKTWLRKQARISGLINSTTSVRLRVAKVGRLLPIVVAHRRAERAVLPARHFTGSSVTKAVLSLCATPASSAAAEQCLSGLSQLS